MKIQKGQVFLGYVLLILKCAHTCPKLSHSLLSTLKTLSSDLYLTLSSSPLSLYYVAHNMAADFDQSEQAEEYARAEPLPLSSLIMEVASHHLLCHSGGGHYTGLHAEEWAHRGPS